ncbi:MAG TPA: pyridoxal 5'-phosphate synthase glutaminase subunit PdxT [Terriglobales bacterium]|nr:pyridoxal 5'-phosphate synthase glutaminase subunit PdxT [Terriglobales bacterium]
MVGVLAIQGDFDAHRRRLESLGATVVLLRNPEQLDELDALVMPGGESSTMLKFLERDGFFDKLEKFVRSKPTFGTCAGAILLAKTVENPPQRSLGAIDIRVKRNAYGRQNDSSIEQLKTKLGPEPLESVFIRAPKIESAGKDVEVLATRDGAPVLIRQGKVMAATFHPELSSDTRVHAEFLKLLGNVPAYRSK